MNKFESLEKKLNYQFKNKSSIEEAFQHASFANEEEGLKSYDRREFLGDALLDMVVSEYLYQKYPSKDEGDLTVLRAQYVDEHALNAIGLYLDLDSYIKFRPQKYHKNQVSESMRGDVVEAIFASVFLETGYQEAKEVILHVYHSLLSHDKDAFEGQKNYKSILQEHYQKKYHKLSISYQVYKTQGPSWDCTFYTYCKDGDQIIGQGFGGSKKEASQMAAKDALERLKENHEQI